MHISAASCVNGSTSSIRSSSASRRARRRAWTRSSGCCSRSPGRRSRTRGQARERAAGQPTGVFVGITHHDYADLIASSSTIAARSGACYTVTGSALNVAAGRLSYCLGFSGPSMAVDTACSSSLVAVHLACQSLRNGECRLALAGGVNLILVAGGDGRAVAGAACWRPTAAARPSTPPPTAIVRGEGCGVVVLKRLSEALARRRPRPRRDPRHGGEPGRPQQRPDGAQRPGPGGADPPAPCADAGLDPRTIDYVEAHGTGTPLGDPIELRALGHVFAADRDASRSWSARSRPTSATSRRAGIAGLIKVVLACEHQAIPPHLNFNEPTPHIPWDELPLTVPTRLTPWPSGGRPRRSGVSSFGFSGVNAHVVLEEAPSASPDPFAKSRNGSDETDRSLQVLALSGRSDGALHQLAERFATHLDDHPELAAGDVCFSANVGRVHLHHRLGIVAASTAEASKLLAAFLRGEQSDGLVHGHVVTPPKVAFLFTGHGPRCAAQIRDLYEDQPIFRRVLDDCNGACAGP